MSCEKEAYEYANHRVSWSGAKLKVIPQVPYALAQATGQYRCPNNHAYSFDEDIDNSHSGSHFGDDLLGMKVDIAKDKIGHSRRLIGARMRTHYDIISRIYDDLFAVEKLRAGLPFPLKYEHGKTWSDLNRHELDLRAEIRRELRELAKDTAFPAKDLGQSVLEFKVQSAKNKILTGGLDDVIELDGSYQTEGDIHP